MPKIVVADDEEDILRLVTFTLQFSGYEVIQTHNGEEAVAAALREMPDLIVMDVRMPRMDGYAACRTIRANEETGHIPVILLSAKGQATEIDEGKEAGATDYMLKPFSPPELIQRIGEILQQA